ncbi:uncharacterized protein AB675_1698 [Cyphellophora attinorum]|uniref:Transcription factor domain-containing protein n=1 Tax=Cyphellophora attinorum TaxID=1664694 RepID=A0A0N0NIZ8_9EURO|nr:uncharacterized protein AB675_1698 [Phialophora attinorum]KPI36029.1 hypothetical protein AB675_1698 [Phialophora attinorum]
MAIHFVEYDPTLKFRNPKLWELQKSRELSHASRVGHGRRRSLKAKRDQDEQCLAANSMQPSSSALDPFLKLAEDVSLSEKNLLHDYLTRVPVEFYGTSPNAVHSAVRESTFQYLSTSKVVLQWTILMAEMRRMTLLALPPSGQTIDTRRQQIYHMMRKQATNPESQLWADDILYGVAFAAMVEYRLGNVEMSQLHLAGCLAIWAVRHRPLSICDRTLLTNAIAVCTISPLASVRGTESAHVIERLKTMERIHFVRRRRSLRSAQSRSSEELENRRLRSLLNCDSTLKLSLDRSITDSTPSGLRVTIATLYILNIFLWGQGYTATDSQVLRFLLKLDHRLLLNLGRPYEEMIRPAPLLPNGLLYNTTTTIYEEMGFEVEYDKVLVCEVVKFVNFLVCMDRAYWQRLKKIMASWVLGIFDLSIELIRYDTRHHVEQSDDSIDHG